MTKHTLEEFYEQHIRPLSPPDRLRLLALVAEDLANEAPDSLSSPRRSILELHGLGAETWKGVDAQEYVNELREEWNPHP
jgi:hypothetical protein